MGPADATIKIKIDMVAGDTSDVKRAYQDLESGMQTLRQGQGGFTPTGGGVSSRMTKGGPVYTPHISGFVQQTAGVASPTTAIPPNLAALEEGGWQARSSRVIQGHSRQTARMRQMERQWERQMDLQEAAPQRAAYEVERASQAADRTARTPDEILSASRREYEREFGDDATARRLRRPPRRQTGAERAALRADMVAAGRLDEEDAAAMNTQDTVQAAAKTPMGLYARRFLHGSMIAVGHGLMERYQAETSAILSGRPDIMQNAGATGGMIGGIAGAAIGALPIMGPFGPIVGSAVGSSLGSAIWQRMAAPGEVALQTQVASLMSGGLSAGFARDWGRPGNMAVPSWDTGDISLFKGVNIASVSRAKKMEGWFSNDLLATVRKGLQSSGLTDEEAENWIPSEQEGARAGGQVIEGLMRAGFNPFEEIDVNDVPIIGQGVVGSHKVKKRRWIPMTGTISGRTRLPRTFAPYVRKGEQGAAVALDLDTANAANAIDASIPNLKGRINMTGGGWEDYEEDAPTMGPVVTGYTRGRRQRWQDITTNISLRYPRAAQEVTGEWLQTAAAIPATGGNMVDMIKRVGSAATYRYHEAFYKPGEAVPVDLDKATQFAAWREADDRNLRMAALKMRGSGAAMFSASNTALNRIAGMPGGMDSMDYAETLQQRNAAESRMWGQADIESFGLPMTRLEGLRARSQYLPFAPGYTFGIALSAMGLRSQQIKKLQTRLAGRRSRGMLTEEDELGFTSQIEGLQTANAADIGMISEGMESRLSALSANTPASFRRYDSWTLAAYNLAAGGVPMRRFGAVSGGQARAQDAFVSAASGSPMNPTSPSGVDNPELVSALKELTNVLKRAVGSAPTRQSPAGQPTVPAKDLGW